MKNQQIFRSKTAAGKLSAFALLALTSFTACKKETTPTPAVTDPYAKPDEVPVLRDGAGFSQKINMLVRVAAGVNGVAGSMGVYDFSIDKSNQLNVLYYTGYQSQQDYLTNAARSIYNWSTKEEIPITSPDKMLQNTSAQNYTTPVFEYLPYSGNVVAFTTSGYRSGYYAQAFWGGVIPMTSLPMISTSAGYTGGAGYYNVFTDIGDVKHYMTINPRPATTDLIWANFEYHTPAMSSATLANFPEPRYSSQGSSVAITICKDSVVAYKILTYSGTGTTGTYAKTGQLTPAGLVSTQEYTTRRHYNAEGTKMSMMVYGTTSKTYWTYTYDFASNTLAAVISNADLPYSGEGSDIDMDEDGNIYYTGIAGEGTKSGVSIYKRSVSGTSLVGTDDFLKFGTVVKLHYLNGKVTVAVLGTVTGHAPWSQLCFITQN